jgi:hypothetical protein
MMRNFVAVLLIAAFPLTAPAASTGLAWDSVAKIATNTDPSSLQPGSFEDDFNAAAAVQPPDQGSGGGLFGKMKQAMAMGQAMGQMMKTGFAERHYVAGSKERTDHLATQTATIVDCAARTIATLDLRHKTYTLVSMDQPSRPSSGGGGSGSGSHPDFNDNGTRVAITVTNTALGPRTVAGEPTQGFRSETTFTVTNASGESHTQNADIVGYYSKYANPATGCSRFAGPPMPGGNLGPGMSGGYEQLLQAFAASGTNSRFSAKQSGPRMPIGMLSMYDAIGMAGQGGGVTFLLERGHVRSINADDAIFSIPADFTKQQ